MYSLFFFFKQKTAYEMRISDWSSDVCSSDLNRYCLHLIAALLCFQKRRDCTCPTPVTFLISVCNIRGRYITVSTGRRTIVRATECEDRKSVVSGKSVSVRVDLGGRRIIRNKNKHMNAADQEKQKQNEK